MTRTADLAIRAFYVLAGAGFSLYALFESTAHSIQYIPLLLGVLLIIQGASGA